MEVYLLYIDDDRYSVPTLDTLNAACDEDARRLARARVKSSKFYRRLELWRGERRVAQLTNPARAPAV